MNKTTEREVYRWLRDQKQAAGPWLGCVMALGIGNGLMIIAQAWFLATIVHGLVMAGNGQTAILPYLGGFLLASLVRAGCLLGREQAGFRAGQAVRQQVRRLLLDRMRQLGPAAVGLRPAGEWLTLLLEQVEELQDFFARYLPQMTLSVAIPLLILTVVLPQNWAVTLIFLGTAPLIPVFMILVGLKAADANRRNFQALSRLSSHFLDRLQGLATLRLFNRSRQEKAMVQSAAEAFRIRTMQVLRLAFLSSTVLEFFASVSIAATALYLGMSYLGYLGFGHWSGELTLGGGLFLLLLAPEFYQPLRELGTFYHARAQAIGAGDRLMHFLNEPVPQRPHGGLTCPAQPAVGIVCDRLTVLAPESDRVLLNQLCFTVAPGEQLAVAGLSGAGKSTLLNVLLGFLDYQGSLKVNGIELRELNPDHWRRQLTWLGQNPLLVCGSVRDNVRLGRHELSDDAINHALLQAHADEIVANLEQGLDTSLGEAASRLSVGQAQRIALARAIVRPAQLVLLDEPTASLDHVSEQLVDDGIRRYSAGKTVLMVTHRPSQVRRANRVLVLDGGECIACDTPDVLCRQDGPFARLWQIREQALDDMTASASRPGME